MYGCFGATREPGEGPTWAQSNRRQTALNVRFRDRPIGRPVVDMGRVPPRRQRCLNHQVGSLQRELLFRGVDHHQRVAGERRRVGIVWQDGAIGRIVGRHLLVVGIQHAMAIHEAVHVRRHPHAAF